MLNEAEQAQSTHFDRKNFNSDNTSGDHSAGLWAANH